MVNDTRITSRLEELRGELRALDQRRERVLGQIEAFEEMMADAVAKTAAGEPEDEGSRRSRGLSSGWKATLRKLSNRESFNYDEVLRETLRAGLGVALPTIRARMSKYAEDGYVERLSDGVYRVTAKGRDAAD